MLSYVEMAAVANVVLALTSFLLCLFFVFKIWEDMVRQPDVGSVGFCLVFVTILAFNLWDVAAYTVIALPGKSPSFLMDLTVFKPPIHFIEVFSFLLLYLHFRKPNEHQE